MKPHIVNFLLERARIEEASDHLTRTDIAIILGGVIAVLLLWLYLYAR